jgi:hypothetical protein
MTPNESDKPLPLRSVLTKPVVVYRCQLRDVRAPQRCSGVVHSACVVDAGRVWWTQPESGIHWLVVVLYGGMNGIFQFLFFSHFVSRFGLRRVFVFSIISCAVIFAIFPFENLAMVAGGGPNLVVWLLIILQLSSLCVFDMGYGKFSCLTLFAHADTHARGVTQVQCICTFHLLLPTNGRSARVWSGAGGVLDSERRWTGCCGLAICVLPDA